MPFIAFMSLIEKRKEAAAFWASRLASGRHDFFGLLVGCRC
jgi:hypothetical protein